MKIDDKASNMNKTHEKKTFICNLEEQTEAIS